LGEALSRIDAKFRMEPSVKAMFLALLRDPQAIPTLERMAKLGVLGRYLPAFGRVSGRMQYDLFHVYTVDQHTLTVLRNMASFADPESSQRFALGHEIWPLLRKPELLLLAGLFHDIAKGRGGDHSELGAVDARMFCLEHGLSAADTDLVAWLVRHHLAMSVTAQRQDIADPEVVARFATLVGERERLDYLYLLTVADIAGTSPKLWNAWKDRLMADLYTATRFALRRGLEHPLHAEERIAETRGAARERLQDLGLDDRDIDRVWAEFPDESFLRYRAEQLAWQTLGIARAGEGDLPVVLARPHQRPGALEVFVYSPDRDGLFATVAATLDRLGLSIVEARVVNSRGGMSLDTFQVLDAGVDFMDPDRRAASVAGSVRDALRAPPGKAALARRSMPRQLKHFRIPARIDFAPADGRTQMTLVCSDRPGLLAQVAAILREHRLRVHDARIATFGERVEDFFQLTDESDQPLDDARVDALRSALLAALDTH
jgi:[protein-PII] uridylyltransferase